MERQYVIKNNRSRERLNKLVNNLTDEELQLVVYKEGWTIAAALGHLAFWDQRRRVLLRKWKRKGVTPGAFGEDILNDINDTTLPFLLAIPPRKAANLAVSTAEAVDRELESISPDLQVVIEALKDRHALNRSIHRKEHLDEIEAFLKTRRTNK